MTNNSKAFTTHVLLLNSIPVQKSCNNGAYLLKFILYLYTFIGSHKCSIALMANDWGVQNKCCTSSSQSSNHVLVHLGKYRRAYCFETADRNYIHLFFQNSFQNFPSLLQNKDGKFCRYLVSEEVKEKKLRIIIEISRLL